MGSKSLLCLAFLAAVQSTAMANTEGDALHALRQSLIDPLHVLQSWDPSLVNPCTWFHVTCNVENHVVRVDLANFSLSGHLVPQLGELSSLQYLEMFSNDISGPIPETLGNLRQLVNLDLFENILTGNIPASLGQLLQLTQLRLDSNELTGTIPLSLTGLSKLEVLDLSDNNLFGVIPVTGSFANFTIESFEGNPGLHYAYAPSADAIFRSIVCVKYTLDAMALLVTELTAAIGCTFVAVGMPSKLTNFPRFLWAGGFIVPTNSVKPYVENLRFNSV